MADPRFPHALSVQVAQQEIYDVIVVGAGPAGSSAAYHLGKQGVNVLLVDRETFPRDKACGDAVMPPAMYELDRMGLADTISMQFTPISHIRTVNFWNNSGDQVQPLTQIGSFTHGYVAPRREFDALLCSNALQQPGCSWLDQVEIRSLLVDARNDPGYAKLHGMRKNTDGSLQAVTLQARLIIAADGSRSTLARQLRNALQQEMPPDLIALTKPADDYERFTARSCYYTGITNIKNTLEFFFHDSGLHYFWVFPVNDSTANVGAATINALSRSHKFTIHLMEHLLHAHLEERGIDAVPLGQWRSSPIRAGLREAALYGHRCICVGDAASLVEPLSDEGISAALFSGRTAAEYALLALSSHTFTSSFLRNYGLAIRNMYEEKYERNIQQLRITVLLQEALATFPPSN